VRRTITIPDDGWIEEIDSLTYELYLGRLPLEVVIAELDVLLLERDRVLRFSRNASALSLTMEVDHDRDRRATAKREGATLHLVASKREVQAWHSYLVRTYCGRFIGGDHFDVEATSDLGLVSLSVRHPIYLDPRTDKKH